MKILTKEEEQAHYNATLKGGLVGGTLGLGVGLAAVAVATRRWPSAFGSMGLPRRAFLVTAAATFGGITAAERASLNFSRAREPGSLYVDEAQRAAGAARATESRGRQLLDWTRDNRYSIVLTSWVAAISVALALVGRNRYLTTAQKVVQARVYAQGLTLAVIVASGALEFTDAKNGRGKWETVMVLDPNDPEHKHLIEKKIHHEEYAGQDLWKDMVATEERRLAQQKKEREEAAERDNSKAAAPKQ